MNGGTSFVDPTTQWQAITVAVPISVIAESMCEKPGSHNRYHADVNQPGAAERIGERHDHSTWV